MRNTFFISVKNHKAFWCVLLGFMVMVIIILCNAACNYKNPPKEILLGYSPLIINLPIMVAYENGYFKEEFKDEDITIKLEPMASTNTMRDAIANQNIHFAASLGTDMFFQNNILKKGNLRGVYFNVLSTTRYNDAIIVKTDSKVKSLSELSGKKIGIYPSSTVAMFVNLIAADAQIIINPVSVSPNEALQFLDKGDIDALFVLEPGLTVAISTNKYRIVEVAPIANRIATDIPVGVCVVNGNFADDFPDLPKKFQNAIEKAVTFIESNKPQAIALGERFLKVESGKFKNVNLPLWKLGCDLSVRTSLSYTMKLYFDNKIITNNDDQSAYILCDNEK